MTSLVRFHLVKAGVQVPPSLGTRNVPSGNVPAVKNARNVPHGVSPTRSLGQSNAVLMIAPPVPQNVPQSALTGVIRTRRIGKSNVLLMNAPVVKKNVARARTGVFQTHSLGQ